MSAKTNPRRTARNTAKAAAKAGVLTPEQLAAVLKQVSKG